jgi:hypothetical protein
MDIVHLFLYPGVYTAAYSLGAVRFTSQGLMKVSGKACFGSQMMSGLNKGIFA